MKTEKVHLVVCAILVCVMMFMSSCAHKSPLKDKMFLQSYGMDGQFVITVDASKLNLGEYVGDTSGASASDSSNASNAAVDYITDRMSRLSIVLFDKTGEYAEYPADLSTYDFEGALEGNYSKTLINTALKLSGVMTQEEGQTGLKFFTDSESGLQAAIPKSGIILFSSSDVEETYKTTFESSQKLISDEQAEKLANCQIGIFVSNPKTLIDLGLDVPKSSLENIEYILVMLEDDTLSIDFKLKSESLARSFSILIKGSYVGQLKREGATIDFEQLKQQFVQEFDMVSVKDLGLTQEQKDAMKSVITELLGVFNF